MFDNLKTYLLEIKIELEKINWGDTSLHLIMEEISQIATDNWVSREDGTPNLTDEQILSASQRALARTYNVN
jgi:hypothetical protein